MIRYCTFCVVIACCFVFTVDSSRAGGFSIPGDYNLDGLVNGEDASIWAATYGSTTELFADGDLNGIVDQVDYQILYENFGATALLAAATDGVASGMGGSVVRLIYDPNNGAIVLDPNDPSERISAFKLITTGAFNHSVANAPFQQFVADPNGFLPDGNTFVQTPTEIGQLDINGGGLPDDGANLGPILPTGLSVGDLQSLLGGSQFFGGSGQEAGFEFVEIPEPATLWGAAVLACVTLLTRRRST